MPTGDLTAPPGPGWWQASDGNWYAPELHPDYIGQQHGGDRREGAVVGGRRGVNGSGSGRAPGPNGGGGYVNGNGNGHRTNHGANGYGTNGQEANGYASNGHTGRSAAANGAGPNGAGLNGRSHGTGPIGAPSNGGANGKPVNVNARTVNGGPLLDFDPVVAARLPAGGPPGVAPDRGGPATTRAGAAGRQIAPASPGLSLAASGSGRPLDDLPFDPMQDPATLLGDFDPQAPARPPVTPPAGMPAPGEPERQARPVRPGFDRSNTPPPGSTVRQQLPKTPFRPRTQGQLPRGDGFDEWLESFAVDPAGRPARVVQPVQRSTKNDVATGGRATIGGPQSAPPRVSNREADFFVMKPTSKRQKPSRHTARRRLSAAVFFAILFIVLAAGTVAVLFIHAHPH